MIAPSHPDNEKERLAALQSYMLLDTPPEIEFDNITKLVATTLDVPIALVTLLDDDRNFLKSHHGVDLTESPRDISFCGHAILEDNPLFIVEDALEDKRFVDNPLVTTYGVRFYVGAQLIDKDGFALGTLCAFDTKPRKLSEFHKTLLIKLANQTVKLFDLHRSNNELVQLDTELIKQNDQLKAFAGMVSHDLKAPLANISSLAGLLKEEYINDFNDEQATQYIDYIEDSSFSLANYVDGILQFYKSDQVLSKIHNTFNLKELCVEIDEMLFVDDSEFVYDGTDVNIDTNEGALSQILINLVGNALKYNHSDTPSVTIKFKDNKEFYHFSVIDNGIGIDEAISEKLFQLFQTNNTLDRHGKKGSGIGLTTVKELVVKLGGTIKIKSKKGEGSTFIFTIKKNQDN